MEHDMGKMTVKEVREYLKTNQTIIFPYGVVEQHGYHLPLSMDIHNAEIPAYALAERLGCIVAPTLNYCFSGGMLPGTINVKPNNFSNFVCDIVESLALQGFLRNLEECIDRMAPVLKTAITNADEARRAGKMVEVMR